MLKSLARKWALFVSRDSRSIVPALLISANGLVFIAVYLAGLVSSELLLGLGIFTLLVGFNLFERVGLLMLLDERDGSESSAERRQDIGALE